MTMESRYNRGDQYPTVEPHGETHLPGGADEITIWTLLPVGSLHFSLVELDAPSNWELIAEGTFIMSAGATYAPGSTGGSATAGPLSHAGTAVAAHTTHAHAAGTPDFGAQAGGDANVWRATTDSAVGGPTTHSVTQPDDHAAFAIIPPRLAAYIYKRVS